jgi:hypothetical protein
MFRTKVFHFEKIKRDEYFLLCHPVTGEVLDKCPAHFIILYWIFVIIFVEEYPYSS